MSLLNMLFGGASRGRAYGRRHHGGFGRSHGGFGRGRYQSRAGFLDTLVRRSGGHGRADEGGGKLSTAGRARDSRNVVAVTRLPVPGSRQETPSEPGTVQSGPRQLEEKRAACEHDGQAVVEDNGVVERNTGKKGFADQSTKRIDWRG